MAHRLLPFRQYDENDVVNLFSLNADSLGTDLKLMKPGDNDINADGVLVSVQNGDLVDVNDLSEDTRFMHSYSSPVGRNPYPTNPLKVEPAASGARALGVTLNQTLAVDENGESLLFNPVKKDELQAVLSGQTVPVLSKGIITVHESAILAKHAPLPKVEVGSEVACVGHGQFGAYTGAGASLGRVIATGHRGANRTSTNNVLADFQSGQYYVIQLDC